MGTVKRAMWASIITVCLGGAVYANWSDSFDGGKLNLNWQFLSFPQVTGTFKQTVTPGDAGNSFLTFTETVTSSKGGAAFAAGFGSAEKFKDVRVGAVVNVAGDACHNYYGLLARGSYFVDPDGKLTGVAPGVVADCYIMHVNYEGGPANLNINLEKVIQNQNIMAQDFGAIVPGVINAHSFYAELDVVGSGPVYVTGSLYEYKGGPLVAQATMIDTDSHDAWEDVGKHDKVFTEGLSGIFAQNEHEQPVGFYDTWDDVSSVSDGPAAVLLGPANGATDVSIHPSLSWVEASFATGRQVWFGTPGNLQLVDPTPTGKTFDPGLLEPGQTYQWRVDEVGPKGIVVIGYTWQFTVGQALTVDDFESYAGNAQIVATWVDNIPGAGFDYTFVETGTVYQGKQALRLECQNQFDPFLTEATRTFDTPQDWTVAGADMLSFTFRGKKDNVEQPLYLRVEDAAGKQATITHPATYAVQSETWRSWDVALSEISKAGVDLKTVTKLTIGVGNGKDSGQAKATNDVDTLYVDSVRLGFLPQ
ncbi:MAG: hypothetical protein NTZ17_21855 [Phycisphaerae bacterium]|nr:hypothetical protein [Phycisphaerae bacterium]